MADIERRDTGDFLLPGPAGAQPVTPALLKAFVSGQRHVPGENGVGALAVLGHDDRERRTDTRDPPLRMICSIEVEFEGGELSPNGTGWLVGPKTVVTAAHVLWWDVGRAVRVRVLAGRDEGASVVDPVESRQFVIHPEWHGDVDQKPENDIAAIRLDRPIGNELGFFGIGAMTDATLAGRFVNIAGYPADKGGTELWHSINRIQQLATERVFYDVDTMPGQSGAPVMLWPTPGQPDAAPLVIGIHARGPEGVELNSATRINQAKLELLKTWIDADD